MCRWSWSASALHHGGGGNWGDLLIPVVVTPQHEVGRLTAVSSVGPERSGPLVAGRQDTCWGLARRQLDNGGKYR